MDPLPGVDPSELDPVQPVPAQAEEGASACVCTDMLLAVALPLNPKPSGGKGPSTTTNPLSTIAALLLLLLLLFVRECPNGWTPARERPSAATNSSSTDGKDPDKPTPQESIASGVSAVRGDVSALLFGGSSTHIARHFCCSRASAGKGRQTAPRPMKRARSARKLTGCG